MHGAPQLLLPVIRGMMEATPAQMSALTVGLARDRPANPLWNSDAASGPRLDPSAAVLMRIITLQQAAFSASVPGSAYRPCACRAQLSALWAIPHILLHKNLLLLVCGGTRSSLRVLLGKIRLQHFPVG